MLRIYGSPLSLPGQLYYALIFHNAVDVSVPGRRKVLFEHLNRGDGTDDIRVDAVVPVDTVCLIRPSLRGWSTSPINVPK